MPKVYFEYVARKYNDGNIFRKQKRKHQDLTKKDKVYSNQDAVETSPAKPPFFSWNNRARGLALYLFLSRAPENIEPVELGAGVGPKHVLVAPVNDRILRTNVLDTPRSLKDPSSLNEIRVLCKSS